MGKMDKKIWVVDTKIVKNMGLKEGFNPATTLNLSTLSDIKEEMVRGLAEKDPSKLQLIPIAVLVDEDNNVLYYVRQGTEKRLHGLVSVSFGGHMDVGVDNCIFSGLKRELKEEIGLKPELTRLEHIGYLYTTKTEVSSVHLGIVYAYKVLDHDRIVLDEEEISEIKFDKPQEILKLENVEDWSALILGYLANN